MAHEAFLIAFLILALGTVDTDRSPVRAVACIVMALVWVLIGAIRMVS